MKEENLKYSVGCDVSKDTIHVCFSTINSTQKVSVKGSREFTNNEKGYTGIVIWINKFTKEPLQLCITMEATGVYHEGFAWFLNKKGYEVSIVLPTKAKRYMQSIGNKSKNDKIDAQGLSRMGAEQCLENWVPTSPILYELRQLTRYHESLNEVKTILKNQLHALKHSVMQNKHVVKKTEKSIQQIDKIKSETRDEIERIVQADPILSAKYKLVENLKGLGLLSWATVVAETGGFALFNNQRQLVSYAGYDVKERQSGRYKGKRCISKQGNSHIRRILHMPALNMVTYDVGGFKNLYERIFERTGIKMKGYVAIQKKLLILLYSLWINDTPFQTEYHLQKQETIDETKISNYGDSIISGNDEPKSLFPLGFAEAVKQVVPVNTRTTQDEHLCNESPKVLFPLLQR